MRMSNKHRQLAAIVFTDIVGYSRLMREDEDKAIAIRARHREVFDELTPKYGGKILQYYGDGTLSIFQSSIAAVECSVEMQKAFRQEPSVPLRIGVHSGDITYNNTDVYGDGLNLASRIESACIPGGVFLSGKVYDDIKNHAYLSAKKVGHFQFKGINEFIDLYAVDCQGLNVPTDPELPHLKESKAKVLTVQSAVASPGMERRKKGKKVLEIMLWGLAFLSIFYFGNSLLEKKDSGQFVGIDDPGEISIAVLPFSNFSENNEDDYFSDGITEDILTTLSTIKDFRVISRTSVMQYKNTTKSIREIGRELNATHILEGSVRKSDNKVRVVAQLIDARNDAHVWADTYDREMTEIFEVQSEVAGHIAGKLKKELSPEDYQTIKKKPTKDLQAYEYYLQGRKYYRDYNEKDNDVAIEFFEKALQIDSTFALAYAGLGDAYSQKANYRSGEPELLNTAMKMSKKAIEIDKNCSEGYKALGLSYHYKGDQENALKSYYDAVKINPNNEMAISNIAMICQDKGKIAEGLNWAKKAMKINPQHPMSFIRVSDLYESIGLDREAEEVLEEGITWNPENEELNFKLADLELKLSHLDKVKKKAKEIATSKPESPKAHMLLGRAAFFEKDYETAKDHFVQAKQLAEKNNLTKMSWDIDMGLTFAKLKLDPDALHSSELKETLTQLLKKEEKKQTKQIQVLIAGIYAALEEDEKAIQFLEKAAEQEFLDYKMLELHPLFDELQDNEQFQQIKEEVRQKAEEIQIEVTREVSSVAPIQNSVLS